MGKLIYTANQTLDGYTVDAAGSFDFGTPFPAVHQFIGDLERSSPNYIYGRRMYETMAVWETMDAPEGFMQDYKNIWRAASKTVVSSTLTEVSSERTTIVRALDADLVTSLTALGDVSIGGPTVAASAIRLGLVDEFRLFFYPISVGGGLPYFPVGFRQELRLIDEHRFDEGVVYLAYSA